MIFIGMNGAQGKMGQRIISLLKSNAFAELQLGSTFSRQSPLNYESLKNIDVLIDFSSPGALKTLLPVARELRRPLVIGTTGYSEEEKKEIRDASQTIPIVLAPNTSLGINALVQLIEMAATFLPNDFSAHIVDIHHANKKDAPSGTALQLKKTLSNLKKNVEIRSLRGGDIVGEHQVHFLGKGERLELTHRATSRDTFARGALRAAEWVKGQNPGLYTMGDVLKGTL